jgi:hypothetical protein
MFVIPATPEAGIRWIEVQERPFLKQKGARGMVQVVEHLPSKYHSATKKKLVLKRRHYYVKA